MVKRSGVKCSYGKVKARDVRLSLAMVLLGAGWFGDAMATCSDL